MKEIVVNAPNFNELLVWGSNKNYNLGFGKNDFANIPQFIDVFRKDNISITSFALSPFHGMFLDKKGHLYAVGSGSKGRLGVNSENDVAVPKRVNKINIKHSEEKISKLSISRYHSMILTNKGIVHVCGSNEFKQLGIKPPPEKLLAFKEVPYFHQCAINDILGISAKDFYSIAYTKAEIYIWGKNLGQCSSIGLEEILLPKQIQIPDCKEIEFVEASNSALAISTTGKHIFLYYNYKIKVIKPPVLEAVKSLSLYDPEIQKTKNRSKEKSQPILKLLLLSDTNVVYIWYEDVQQFLRCSFSPFKLSVIDKIFFKHNQIFLMSQGDVFVGKCNKIPISNIIKESETAWLSSNQTKKDINGDYKIRIELARVDGIDRAVDICCDESFESFAVLQEHSRKYFVLPKLHSEEYNFKKLLNDVSEFDAIHDIVFHIDNEVFYAHKLIIYSRSKGLKEIIMQQNSKNIYLNYKNFTSKMFEMILKHIYCHYFLTLDDMDDINNSFLTNFNEKESQALDILIEVAEKFTLTDFVLHIKSILDLNSDIKAFDKTKTRFTRIKRLNFPELYDVKIKCANNQELLAHKCVLVTRLEYFNMMFTNSWCETTAISLTTIPIEYMQPILDFLYTNDIENFRKQNYNENFLYNMIVICDQFFINRLRKLCETLVLEKISIRRCGEMLEFAVAYNCEILKRGCMDFICQNLSRVLFQRSLEMCEPQTLKYLNMHYRQVFQNIFDFRVITPDSEAISDEDLLKFVGDSIVDLDYKLKDDMTSLKNVKKGKSKEEKFKSDRRNYEKDAILSKLKELNMENEKDMLDKEKQLDQKEINHVLKEANEINEKLIADSSSWTKINKKEETRKKSIGGNIKANNILKEEKKQKENFVNLNKIISSPPNTITRKNSEIKSEIENIETKEYTTHHSLNFGDFTPYKNSKMSQKQRKRLSSETSLKSFDSFAAELRSSTKPIDIPVEKASVWGNVTTPPSNLDHSSSFSDIIRSTPDKIRPKSLEFCETNAQSENLSFKFDIDILNNNSFKKSTGATPKQNSIMCSSKLNQILEEEKRQKEYLEHVRSKSLVLTQIEEKAIAELGKFYNVDNCEDEIITISRRPVHINFNLPTWQKN
ncbi:inhibitor of Bruton tyrosine kinase-like isoform X2 [Condylostylus longicornis]|nr:inhibitor of Bruton tyrosine kinase-like isoform X2 [Condylostylus longicornis]